MHANWIRTLVWLAMPALLIAPSASAATTVPHLTMPSEVAQPAALHAPPGMQPDKKAFGGFYLFAVDSDVYGNEGTLCTNFLTTSSGEYWVAGDNSFDGTWVASGKTLFAAGYRSASSSSYDYTSLQGKLKGKGAAGTFDYFDSSAGLIDYGSFTLTAVSIGSCVSSSVRVGHRHGELLSP